MSIFCVRKYLQREKGKMVSLDVVLQKYSMRWALHFYCIIIYAHQVLSDRYSHIPIEVRDVKDTRTRRSKFFTWVLKTMISLAI